MELWMIAGLLCVLVVLASWRWSRVTHQTLTDDECRLMADELVSELFTKSSQAGDLVPVLPSVWEGLDRYQPIALARWMNGNKYVSTGDWGILEILIGRPPGYMALTQREYDKALVVPRTTNVISGDGTINNNHGGLQIVAGGDVDFNADFLLELAHAVHDDAASLDALQRHQALSAVDVICEAASGRLDQASPRFQGTINWLKDRANDAAGGALGTALWTATTAVLSRL